MALYLLRNTVQDHEFNYKRKTNRICRAPVVGGMRIPAGTTRRLTDSELTDALLAEIAPHQEVGNLQLLRLGPQGGPVDLSHLLPEKPKVVHDPVPYVHFEDVISELADPTYVQVCETVDEDGTYVATFEEIEEDEDELVRARNEDGTFMADDPTTPENEAFVEVPEDRSPATVEDLVGPVEPDESEFGGYTSEDLFKMTVNNLRELLITRYKISKTSGKAKKVLVDMVLDAQKEEANG